MMRRRGGVETSLFALQCLHFPKLFFVQSLELLNFTDGNILIDWK